MANPYFTKAKVIQKEFIKTKDNFEPTLLKIKIKMSEPELKTFRPGQFCTFRVAEGIFRAYSVASSYKNFEEYEFLISCGHEGIGANYFRNLKEGDEVVFLGPNGHFRVIVPVASELLFVATGTGISPYIPMIEFLTDNSCETKINLIHGIRDERNLEFYQSIHDGFKKKCPNFESHFFISQPKTNLKNYTKGRVSDYVKSLDFDKLNNHHIYLCGHPEMITELSDYLLSKGLKEENLMIEAFTSPGAYEKIN